MIDRLDPDHPILQAIESRAGIAFSGDRGRIATRRIADRMAELGISSTGEYGRRLSVDPAEVDRLVEAISVQETVFFRHTGQVEALERRILPALADRAQATGRPFVCWSAGCANGCEIYSLAILCTRLARRRGDFPFELLATDISERALEKAAEGVYADREVRSSMPAGILHEHFRPEGPGRWRIDPEVARRVRFARANLLSDVLPQGCDLILLRNVLYYFSTEARQRVLRRIWATQDSGGLLMVAPTEALNDVAAYYRPVDSPARLYECWRTRRRIARPDRAVRDDTIVLAGTVERPDEIRFLAGRLSRGPSATIDATGLEWISNDALHELGRIVREAARRGTEPEIEVADAAQEEWFRGVARTRRAGPPAIRPAVEPAPAPPRFEIRLPVEATDLTLGPLRQSLERALVELERPGAESPAVVLDAAGCVFLDEAHGLLLARFLQSLEGKCEISIDGASGPVERFLSRYMP